jgi:hypothetical protein
VVCCDDRVSAWKRAKHGIEALEMSSKFVRSTPTSRNVFEGRAVALVVDGGHGVKRFAVLTAPHASSFAGTRGAVEQMPPWPSSSRGFVA